MSMFFTNYFNYDCDFGWKLMTFKYALLFLPIGTTKNHKIRNCMKC